MRMGTTEPFDSMNPFVAFSAISYDGVHERLPDARAVRHATSSSSGDWAKSWTTSKDGLTWTFKVKPGKWSDGKPLTADDARLDGQH